MAKLSRPVPWAVGVTLRDNPVANAEGRCLACLTIDRLKGRMMETRYDHNPTRRTLVPFDHQPRAGGEARVAK